MSCQRSWEIELAEFLADPRAEAFREFRAHYPHCADCAAEVRAWTEFHEALAADHPEPEALERYDALDAGRRAAVDRHLARCASCREERGQLAGLTPARLRALAAPPSGDPQPGWREALAGLGRILWHPAFGYALAALLVFPLVYRSADRVFQDFDVAQSERLAKEGFAPAPAKDRPALAPADERSASAPAKSKLRAAGADDEVLESLPAARHEVARAPRAAKRAAPARELDAADALERKAEAPQASERTREFATAEEAEVPRPSQQLRRDRVAAEPAPAAAPPERQETRAPSFLAAESRAQGRVGGAESVGAALLNAPVPQPVDARVVPAPGAQTFELQLPLPAGTPPGVAAELRLAFAGGRRQLVEQMIVPEGAPVLRVQLPRSWLDPGEHRATLVLPDGRTEYRFQIPE